MRDRLLNTVFQYGEVFLVEIADNSPGLPLPGQDADVHQLGSDLDSLPIGSRLSES
jgi:hypothetical protein